MVRNFNLAPDDDGLPVGKIVGIGAVVFVGIFLLAAIFSTIYFVKAGFVGVVLTFGKPEPQVTGAGIHIKVPFVQSVVHMDIRTQKYEAPATAASQDLQIVTAQIATNFHIDGSQAPAIYSNLGLNYPATVIQPMEQEAVKATTAQFTAEQLITDREAVRQKIRELLIAKLQPRGIVVEDVSVVNFDFSASFNDAIEAKVTAEQNALKEQNQLKVVEYQAQQKVAAATGDAKSIQIINQQLQNSPDYVQYLLATKWNGQLPQVTSGTPLISLPMR